MTMKTPKPNFEPNATTPRSAGPQQDCSVSNVANTPITEAFARTADWKSAMQEARKAARLRKEQNASGQAREE